MYQFVVVVRLIVLEYNLNTLLQRKSEFEKLDFSVCH